MANDPNVVMVTLEMTATKVTANILHFLHDNRLGKGKEKGLFILGF